MARSALPMLFLLAALLLAGCSGAPKQEARSSAEDTKQRTVAEPTGEQTTTSVENTGSENAGGSGGPEYIVIGESEREEGGVRTAQVIVTAKKTSKRELRNIVEDLKDKYRNTDAASVEIMDGPAGFGKAGSAVIMNTDEGARHFGYPDGVPNSRGYVLKTAD
ncbi:MAG TPA: hypothetical protein VFJ72_01885 [Rubrobacteraceae bacterium]|nr:hypothetical protein [Rubrobacteraceae bacterium]